MISQESLTARRDGDVVLRDGSTVHIRVMNRADEAGLCALLNSLSEESRWLRFTVRRIAPAWLPKLIERRTWTMLSD